MPIRRMTVFRLFLSGMVLASASWALTGQSGNPGKPRLETKALEALRIRIDKAAEAVQPKVVGWRRDFHQNPELGNREFRTAEIVAGHLKALGLEVK